MRDALVSTLIWAVWVLVSTGCDGSAVGSDRPMTLVITGSSTVAPLVAEIAKRYEQIHPGTRVDVQTGGSSRGLADTRRGLADIGMVSRALREDERDLIGAVIALDGVCVIVHRDNPLNTLSRQQIVDIYTGKVTNWNQVGGGDAPITIVHKADGRSTQEVFLSYLNLDAREVRPSVIIGDNQHGMKTVAGNPHAIGYVSIGAAQYEATHGVSIKPLPLQGVAPTTANVRHGVFPMIRPLVMVTKPNPTGQAQQFVLFACSKEVHDLVTQQHFIAPPQ